MLRRPTHNPLLILFTLWLMVFSAASQVMIVAPILPRISEALDVPVSLLGTLMTVYALAVGVCALVTGPISDRVGRRRVLLFGTGLMSVALALHALATTFVALVTLRTLAGMAGGVLSGAAVAYVGDYFPSNRRGWANGWVMSGLAAGQIAGVPLGTILANAFDFQAPFLVFSVVMALAFGLIWARLPQPEVERAGRLSVRGALRGYAALLRRPDVLAAGIAFALLFASISLYVVYLPTWLEVSLGFSGTAIAGLYFMGGVANVMAGPQAGRLSDRIGRKGVIIGASLGVVVLMIVTPLAHAHWVIYALFFLTMALFASRVSPLQALLTEMVRGSERGSLMSLTMAIGQIGFAVGSAGAGAAYAAFGYGSNTLLAAVAVGGMIVLVWRFLPEPSTTDDESPAGSVVSLDRTSQRAA